MPLKMFNEKKPATQIIGIAAGKGGVGKSAVTVNLALALNALGYKVGILDADLYGPSIRMMLPEERRPAELEGKLIPAISKEIAIMSMAFFKSREEAALIRAPIANRLIGQFLNQVEWGNLDYLLIDFPPGTGDIQITLSQQANLNGAIVVTTPQEVALLDVRKCIAMFQEVKIPVLGIVENMSYFETGDKKVYIFGQNGGQKLAAELNLPLLAQIPIDPLIGQCLDSGTSLFEHDSKTKDFFIGLAQNLGKKPLSAINIQQKNPFIFTIKWQDGKMSDYSVSDIQKICPCALCTEKGVRDVKDDVAALKIANIGNYAIKIDFTSGCSHGIYGLDTLHNMRGDG